MATLTASKPIDLKQLEGELIAALPSVGIMALASTGGDLATNATKSIYGIDAQGQLFDLPAGAAPVIASHTPIPPATPYDSPVSDLQAARDGLADARATLTTAIQNLNAADDTAQAWSGSQTAAVLTTALKTLSARNRAVVAAQAQADLAIVDALAALYDAIVALKARS